MTAWVVRGGTNLEWVDEFLEKGLVQIGFDITEDLTDWPTLDDLKRLYGDKHPDALSGTVTSNATQLRDFRDGIEIGDLVLTPRSPNGPIAIGNVIGGYEYRPQEYPGTVHVRRVRWIRDVDKDSLAIDLTSSVDASGTIHRIGTKIGLEIAEKRLRAIAETDQDIYLEDVHDADPLWDAFISWAKLFYEWKLFDERERDYKLEFAEGLATVKEDFRVRIFDWDDSLKKMLISPDARNLTDWRVIDPFVKLDLFRKEEALDLIWGMDSDTFTEEQVRNFQEFVPGSPANKTSLTSLLLIADGATRYPPYRYTPLQTAYRLTGRRTEYNNSPDVWDRYAYALTFWDKFIEQASVRGLHLRDRLDSQGLVWCITHYKREDLPDDWPEYVKDKLIAYRAGEVTEVPTLPPPPPSPWYPANIEGLAEELLWEPNQLQGIIDDLREKRQVIFHGPPGTGKTYVARQIAKHAQDYGGGFEIVQFHPSYSYEDFVEGYRPTLTENGQPAFKLVQGPLRRIAERARDDPNSTFILVIDELNRGNVAKVFGELYFLLEYRDEEVRLQYGGDGEGFSLPRNLWFICTMNTADRSIALMDAALRRRFYFAPFFPDEPPVKGLLHRWLDENDPGITWVADLVDKANEKLNRDMRIGPSYFMDPSRFLDENRVRRIWERAVIPYVEEQCFGDDAKLAEFDFDRLKGQIGDADSNSA